MNTFSFRAECEADVDRFQELLRSKLVGYFIFTTPAAIAPDVLVEILTDSPIESIRSILAEVPDGHVMVETLRHCPLQENSLERERMRP